MCKWNNGGITVALPDGMCTWKQNRTVCIDECIIKQIKALWAAGYETLASCCGHGKLHPSVVVGDGYSVGEVKAIAEILKRNDDRAWTVYQWRLQEVASTQRTCPGCKSFVVDGRTGKCGRRR